LLPGRSPSHDGSLHRNLADTRDRGALDVTDFVIGMYFIQAVMSGKVTTLPSTLPPNIYSQASGGMIATHATGTTGSGSFSPTRSTFPSSIRLQYTGSLYNPTMTSVNNPPSASALPPVLGLLAPPLHTGSSIFGTASLNAGWDITPAQKASSDHYFDTLDPQGRGYIEGKVAAPFMSQSKLSDEELGQIWELTDILKDGKLSRDCFAVAMHLIKKRLAGNLIPTALPATLVPPSMRMAVTSGLAPFFPPDNLQRHSSPQHMLGSDESPPRSAIGSFRHHNGGEVHNTDSMSITPPAHVHVRMLEEEIRHLRERIVDLENRERERVTVNGGEVVDPDHASIAPPAYEDLSEDDDHHHHRQIRIQ
jgi:epidermal growth factor receptor substrate 15